VAFGPADRNDTCLAVVYLEGITNVERSAAVGDGGETARVVFGVDGNAGVLPLLSSPQVVGLLFE
jgi:hypothetical protein